MWVIDQDPEYCTQTRAHSKYGNEEDRYEPSGPFQAVKRTDGALTSAVRVGILQPTIVPPCHSPTIGEVSIHVGYDTISWPSNYSDRSHDRHFSQPFFTFSSAQ